MHTGRDMLRKGLRMQLSKEKSCTRQHYPRRYSRLQSSSHGKDTVKKSAIIITKLKTPVDFTLMGSDNETVPVNIIFTLAVNGAEHQLTILQKLVGMFSEKESMERIKASTTPKEIMNSLIELLS